MLSEPYAIKAFAFGEYKTRKIGAPDRNIPGMWILARQVVLDQRSEMFHIIINPSRLPEIILLLS